MGCKIINLNLRFIGLVKFRGKSRGIGDVSFGFGGDFKRKLFFRVCCFYLKKGFILWKYSRVKYFEGEIVFGIDGNY